ncbi:SAF domain-containing protein [Hamadaea tsunoensis]|uniref:SAF domain-containing protein n=1 Tax=Hamadaea tsunoensis TaxID=53368 RepID=UPI00040E9455|nr:SAF domain-containing protein [Hamadaea tsunoensis]
MSMVTSARPPAAPLTVPRLAPRRRSLWQGALAVLLIAAGALTAGYVAQRMGSTQDYLAVARPVGQGQAITVQDLLIVRVNSAMGLRPVAASQAGKVIGKHAVMALVPGALLTMDQVTDTPIPAPGKQLVGLALDEEYLPSARLAIGAAVVLVVIPDNSVSSDQTSPDLTPPRTIAATVVDVRPGSKDGTTLLNVEVAAADAATVAALGPAKRIAVALVNAPEQNAGQPQVVDPSPEPSAASPKASS